MFVSVCAWCLVCLCVSSSVLVLGSSPPPLDIISSPANSTTDNDSSVNIVTSRPVRDGQTRIEQCEARQAEMRERANRPRLRPRPVCGTNGQTYASRCHLVRAACQGGLLKGSAVSSTPRRQLKVKHRGRCRERQPCRSRGGACLPDGRFAPVQCHPGTGYCWCVTPNGKPIPNTTRRNRRPKCKARRPKTRRGGTEVRGRKMMKDCSRVDRSAFVTNLVRIFSTDYQKDNPDGEASEEIVLDWKFGQLDVDRSGFLSRDEYAEVRRLVRRVARPRRCSRAFAKLCDLDRDLRIARHEWTACLALHLNLPFRLFLSLNPAEPGVAPTDDDVITPQGVGEAPDGGDGSEGDDGFSGVLQEGTMPLMETGAHSLLGEDGPDNQDDSEPEANNCLSDQRTALDEQKLGTEEMYVPECTQDGRYEKVQCYKSTGYCWCVHEDTGKPIPGTSLKDSHPKCDSVQAPSRPMKGCPEFKKQAFLKDLMEYLMQSGAAQKINIMVLERKEWKAFRAVVGAQRKLRPCGKKLPRYCDVNHDKRVSLTEWLSCLHVNKTAKPIPADNMISSTASPRRRGINPLDVYLKED
ncbi:SPARC-related modular calcium-binding protein 1 [Nilaparvata lugens]|uniref:SPARC-related modular calcium-binding protein 1 n=1 Tax=Nilaparvata lugens TaxID=108931 RepID=UPI00193DBEDB|nr:SPARC-related modular calcium-binding protein 1 [Nilaparvata lugens]